MSILSATQPLKWLLITPKAIKTLLSFSAPICSTHMIGISVNFLSIMMVAKLGELPLAASALATALYTCVMLIFSSILYAVSIFIGHTKASKSDAIQPITSILHAGIWLAIALSIPSGILLLNAPALLTWSGQDPELVQLVRTYFYFAALNMCPMLLSTVCAQFFMGLGDPKITLYTALIRLPFILLFSYAFILGRLGLPSYGLAGIMLATSVVQTLYVIGQLIFLKYSKKYRVYGIGKQIFNPDFTRILKLFQVGLPIGLQYGVELFLMSIITLLMGYFGVTVLAAYQWVSQFLLLFIMLIHGSAQALSVLVSQARAKQEEQLIITYFNAALILMHGLLFISTIVFLHPALLVRIFAAHEWVDHEFVRYVQIFLMIAIFSLWLDGIRVYLTSALRGLRQTKMPMLINQLSLLCLSAPCAYALAFTFQWGPFALSAGYISGYVLAILFLAKLWCQSIFRVAHPNTSNRAVYT